MLQPSAQLLLLIVMLCYTKNNQCQALQSRCKALCLKHQKQCVEDCMDSGVCNRYLAYCCNHCVSQRMVCINMCVGRKWWPWDKRPTYLHISTNVELRTFVNVFEIYSYGAARHDWTIYLFMYWFFNCTSGAQSTESQIKHLKIQ